MINTEEQTMPRGNASDPFSRDGINFEGSRGYDDDQPPAGNTSRNGIDWKGNRKPNVKGSGIGTEQTVVDKPLNSSAERSKRTSNDEYYPDNWYGTPPSRQR
jgi:hypothetical protein